MLILTTLRHFGAPSAEARQCALQYLAIAKVAKLVDAPGLGPDAVTGVGVRVPPFAPAIVFPIRRG